MQDLKITIFQFLGRDRQYGVTKKHWKLPTLDFSLTMKLFVLLFWLFISVFLFCPLDVHAVDGSDRELLTNIKTIRLIVKVSSWLDKPHFDIESSIKSKTKILNVNFVPETEKNYDATLFVDYAEIKGQQYSFISLPSSAFGTTINCSLKLHHPKFGIVYENNFSASTSESLSVRSDLGISNSILVEDAVRNFQQAAEFQSLDASLACILSKADIIATLLKDGEIFKKIILSECLGDRGVTEAVEPLINCLKEDQFYVKRSIIKALGKIGDMRALKPLTYIYENDNDKDIRQVAKESLDQISKHKAK